jgi:hypothetical protein
MCCSRYRKCWQDEMCCRWSKPKKRDSQEMEWFLDTVARLESVAPGMVFGAVDVVCCGCGETSSHTCNADGRNAYVCPHGGVRNEL